MIEIFYFFYLNNNLPISDGKFLNLLFDKSSVTRFVKQAISDGKRVN
jgi:hypothetical protein